MIIAISIIAITLFFFHFQLDRSSYKEWNIEKPGNDSTVRFERESTVGKKPVDFDKLKITNWKIGSLYYSYFKFTAILILIYLSLNQFGKVLKSVKELETFHQTNVHAFRRIGYYCLFIAGLSLFSYWEFGDYTKSSVSVSMNVLFTALLAFILAEVFKEGNNLMEENQLTI
ncbi:DUF2975 domain-containing protein [Gramella jeungdoensis]|uniref:DUF2975 domain-containing protein n=1 Tax=Gramella jeungdoensis TaxID=708091 RepID=A0ABT0Z5F0_9FLAO|nr:DUF2975 domain-containing protein [Gramella jeungdoensis]MCM8570950.1 DUF2975 domain-containing protein [Gramella jeungdoensis]